MNLFLDIETIGTEDADVIASLAADIGPPANYCKPETIAAWEAEKKPALVAEAVLKTAFDGGLGRIICIGLAEGDRAACAYLSKATEADLLKLLPNYDHATVIGHNVGWDIRFLWQRCIVNRVTVPRWLRIAVKAKPWEITDTMTMWNSERDKKVSLEKLCRILGVPTSKGEMDGSKVWEAWKAGKVDEIADYCRRDVVATRECYLRMAT